MADSGRHKNLTVEDQLKRISNRQFTLEKRFDEHTRTELQMQQQVLLLIELQQSALLGIKVATWIGRVIRWCLLVGASGVAIWAAWRK